MSKLAPFILAGLGATATSVGTTYLIKGTSKSGTEKSKPGTAEGNGNAAGKAPGSNSIDADLGFTDLSGFRSKKGGSCATGYFGSNLDFNGKGETIDSSSHKIADNHFSTTAGTESPAEGCLVINWERTNHTSGNKWKGGFRWLWSFKKGDKGFVMFVTTKPSSAAKTLDLDGGIYFLEKGSGDAN